MHIKVVLEEDEEVGGYMVSCTGLPGCFSQRDITEEVFENIKEAIQTYLESLGEDEIKLYLTKPNLPGCSQKGKVLAQIILRMNLKITFNQEYNMNQGTNRANIKQGLSVGIVLKQDQRSGKITKGIVKRIVTIQVPSEPI